MISKLRFTAGVRIVPSPPNFQVNARAARVMVDVTPEPTAARVGLNRLPGFRSFIGSDHSDGLSHFDLPNASALGCEKSCDL
jgi:hypothetical protein